MILSIVVLIAILATLFLIWMPWARRLPAEVLVVVYRQILTILGVGYAIGEILALTAP